MSCTAIVDALFGDGGKGKLSDILARGADIVARFGGGNNAGHTVIVGKTELKLHLLPCGVLHPGVVNVIGNGTVVDLSVLEGEIRQLREIGIDLNPTRLRISPQAHIILPTHRFRDARRDATQGIGTTGRGIGPAYEDKMARCGLRAGDFLEPETLPDKIGQQVDRLQDLYGDEPLDTLQSQLETYLGVGQRMRPYIADTVTYLNAALDAGKSMVAEGAQGTFIDIDHGTFPYVTSSNPTIGGACTGLGISPKRITEVIGVVKAYSTRVGAGPFPTEEPGTIGDRLRSIGKEYGTTTGRDRRCGWIDLVLLRHAAMINGFDWIFLTKLDVLSEFDEIKICDRYLLPDGSVVTDLSQVFDLGRVRPIYHTLQGWRRDITGARSWADLPVEAHCYIRYVEERIGAEARMISVGPDRAQTIESDKVRYRTLRR